MPQENGASQSQQSEHDQNKVGRSLLGKEWSANSPNPPEDIDDPVYSAHDVVLELQRRHHLNYVERHWC